MDGERRKVKVFQRYHRAGGGEERKDESGGAGYESLALGRHSGSRGKSVHHAELSFTVQSSAHR